MDLLELCTVRCAVSGCAANVIVAQKRSRCSERRAPAKVQIDQGVHLEEQDQRVLLTECLKESYESNQDI